MPPRRTTVTSKKSKSKLNLETLDSYASTSKSASPTPPTSATQRSGRDLKKAPKPLSSFTRVPSFSSSIDTKGKGKTSPPTQTQTIVNQEEPLWVDKYTPTDELQLAVHKRKVEEVRHWLEEAFEGGPTGSLKKYRRVLALTGHAGTGKTATLRVLAKEMGFEILEWSNTLDDKFGDDEEHDRESLIHKFRTFLTRASACRALPMFSDASSSSALPCSTRKVILLEDFPNILHAGTAEAFHAALEEYVSLPSPAPLICIIPDTGIRGEDPENDTMGSRNFGRGRKQALDVRTIIPRSLHNSPYFREIQFNPIAPTLMTKALTAMMSKHFSGSSKAKDSQQPSKETIQLIVETSNGDIRSAIMALQFACVVQLPKGSKKAGVRTILEAVTRREQSLALFHMLGKILYNKRKGDPPASSISAGERDKLEEFDRNMPDPPPLPEHLAEHARRASKVHVETLYADSPVDTSLFALYLHQNYTQFCDEVDECEALCDWLSWIDSSGSESWQSQRNPHQFHILAIGALHSLPSPVTRRSQKMFKPEFFENLQKYRDAEAAVVDTEEWLATFTNRVEGGRMWSKDEIILEIGGVVNALGAVGLGNPPPSHSRFSKLTFHHPSKSSTKRMEQLGEDEEPPEELIVQDDSASRRTTITVEEEDTSKGWLETDDIQEF
ncbi:hypothetical protein M422DRAFT_42307 [Sphaerobolus stellatus SS14]|nr:hypothetical protein M422DRAFT_42307 [Sphaerobolus stellatus SS14]